MQKVWGWPRLSAKASNAHIGTIMNVPFLLAGATRCLRSWDILPRRLIPDSASSGLSSQLVLAEARHIVQILLAGALELAVWLSKNVLVDQKSFSSC